MEPAAFIIGAQMKSLWSRLNQVNGKGHGNERGEQKEVVMKPRFARGTGSGIGMRAVGLTALLLSLTVSSAYSEMYIGGQVGTTLFGDNNKLARVDLTDLSGPPGSTLTPPGSMSGRDLAGSPVLGGKIGYYFPQIPWFGLELEGYYTTPHIEQQPTRVSLIPGSILNGVGPVTGGDTISNFSGDLFRVVTIAPFNLVFRYHKTRFQPYVGIGPGIFMARVKTTVSGFEGTQSSTKVGLNVKLGGEYFLTRHISGYAEVRYNYTRFSFDATDSGSFGFNATYNPIIFSFGVGYHF